MISERPGSKLPNPRRIGMAARSAKRKFENGPANETNIRADEEFRHIMEQNPAYIIVKEDYPAGAMRDYIRENYSIVKEFDGKVYIYGRK